MRMEVKRPETLQEALALLQKDKALKIVAGGTDLIPRLNQRLEFHEKLMYIKPYPELCGVRKEEDGRLFVGAYTRLSDVAKEEALKPYGALCEAASHVASYQIRNQATIGGNILQENRCMYFNNQIPWSDVNHCFKWGGGKCFQYPNSKVCMALFQSDVAPVLMSYGASVRIQGPDGTREEAVEKLYLSGGKKALAHDEILLGILLPELTAEDKSVYVRWTLRGTFDFPLLGCALSMRTDGETVNACSIVFGAAGIKPQPFPAGNEAFTGKKLKELTEVAASLSGEAGKRIMAFRDTHVDGDVRKEKAAALLRQAVEKLAENA